MYRPSQPLTLLTLTGFLCGQGLLNSGSVWAEDVAPVAADLVELAIAIPEALTDIEDADQQLPFLLRQQKNGFVTDSDVDVFRRQREQACRQLELLRFIVEAELNATQMRSEFLKARQEDVGIDAPVRITAAEQRLHVLSLLKEACKIPKADDEQAALHPQDLPPAEAIIANSALATDVIAP